jgi:hypothetical protein
MPPALCDATVVVEEFPGACTPGALVGGIVDVGPAPFVVGGAGDVVATGGVVVSGATVVVDAFFTGAVVVVGTLVMVNPPPGLGSTNTPCDEFPCSVLTPSHNAPRPTNKTTSSTVERRILIRSETGPRTVDTMLLSFDINQASAPSGGPASVSALP